MKKIIIFLLATMFLFAACGPEESAAPTESSSVENTENTEKTENTENAENTENTEEPEEVGFKVGVIYSGDPELNGSSASHERGIVAMQNSIGLEDSQLVRRTNVAGADAAAVRAAVEECIAEGCGLIFGTDSEYAGVMAELAQAYPEVVFSVAGGNINNGTNLNSYSGRLYQAQYLCGIAAGLRTESGMIGYVASKGLENSEVTGGIDAFAMGVERVNPDARVYVRVTGSRSDSELEGTAAYELINQGCDVIAQHCDTAAPQLAAEEMGVWGCGYNRDMSDDAPSAHLAAPIWNWGVYYTMATKAVMEGSWTGESYYGGMHDAMIELSALSDNCADGTEDEVEAATEEILGGSEIFSGEIVDNQGNVVCGEGATLADETIQGGINWYYRNVVVM